MERFEYLNTAVAYGGCSLDTSHQSHRLAKQYGHSPLHNGLESSLAHFLVKHTQKHCVQTEICVWGGSVGIKWRQNPSYHAKNFEWSHLFWPRRSEAPDWCSALDNGKLLEKRTRIKLSSSGALFIWLLIMKHQPWGQICHLRSEYSDNFLVLTLSNL